MLGWLSNVDCVAECRLPPRGQAPRYPPCSADEAKVFYAEKHENLWIEFVEQAVERAGYPELADTTGISKAEFAAKIQQLN